MNRLCAAPDRRRMLQLAALGGGLALLPAAGVQAAATASRGRGRLDTDPSDVADTRYGRVRGYHRDGVRIFKGIPYGADTGGARRFRPPAAPAAWSGVRTAMHFGPASPQPPRDWSRDDMSFVFHWDDGYFGEDMLRANVWSPIERNGALPVMVWLHGGGFTAGSSQELPAYDGEALARNHGVVMVSVNHRLGPLGYLDLSEYGDDFALSGNAGMLDLVAALQWVRDNIAAFGGDPGNVTIFGQSGGGSKVSTLMGMPAAAGLFHKAIIQSGSSKLSNDTAQARKMSAAVMAELGLGRDVRRLQEIDPAKLIAAGREAQRKLNGPPGPPSLLAPLVRGIGWSPVVDGQLIPAVPFGNEAPAFSRDVPLMVGATQDEFPQATELTEADLIRMLPADRGSAVVAEFRRAFPTLSPKRIATAIGAMGLRNGGIDQAAKKAAQGTAAYNYWFTWQSPVLDGRLGAMHCFDLPFCFDNVERWDTVTGNSADARRLGDVMSKAWTNFAKTGDPSQKGLAWPRFDPATVPTMVFDSRSRVEMDPKGTARRLTLQA